MIYYRRMKKGAKTMRHYKQDTATDRAIFICNNRHEKQYPACDITYFHCLKLAETGLNPFDLANKTLDDITALYNEKITSKHIYQSIVFYRDNGIKFERKHDKHYNNVLAEIVVDGRNINVFALAQYAARFR
jgi:hypothetical protein